MLYVMVVDVAESVLEDDSIENVTRLLNDAVITASASEVPESFELTNGQADISSFVHFSPLSEHLAC